MPIRIPQNNNFKKELIPAGIHKAVCFGAVDIGSHLSEYKGSTKYQRKVVLLWEFPEAPPIEFKDKKTGEIKIGPKIKSMEYTLSFYGSARLKQHLESWRGKAFTDEEIEKFEIDALIGKNCQIQISHSEDGKWDNIQAVIMANQGQNLTAKNPVQYFSFDDGNDIPEHIYDWLKEKIFDSVEWGERVEADKVRVADNFIDSDGAPVPADAPPGMNNDGSFTDDDNLPF